MIRYLSTSTRRLKLPPIVLESLHDSSDLFPNPRREILILEPKKPRIQQYVPQPVTSKPTLSLLQEPEDESILSIDQLHPNESQITISRYNNIRNTLARAFSKTQLIQYLEQHIFDRVLNWRSKKLLLALILDEVWKVKKTSQISSMDDLLTTQKVRLSQRDLFLLLSQNGVILKHVSGAAYKVLFRPKSKEIVFKGTSYQVQNALINLERDLKSAQTEKFDLGSFRKLFEEKFGRFSIEEIGKNTEVYFQHVEDDMYELCALNNNQLKRTKRLLLWMLNYNQHTREAVERTPNATYLPYKDDDVLAWNERAHEFVVARHASPAGPSLQAELHRYTDENLLSLLSLEEELAREDRLALEQKSWEYLDALGFKKVEEETSAPAFDPSIIGEDVRERIHKQVTDLSYHTNLNCLPSAKHNPPILSVTLGNLLFAKDSDKAPYVFNSNVPLLADAVMALPPLDASPSDTDPHTYSVQLKFLPTPFVETLDSLYNTDLTEQMKYPPIEIWADLSPSMVPDLELAAVITVEAENNVHVSLPDLAADLKVSCQISGNVLEDNTVPSPETELSNISEILDSTAPRYARFNSQPGIIDFFKRSKIDFGGSNRTNIHQELDVVIGDNKVKYHYVNIAFRRSLQYSIGERVVELSVVEGGLLGGRRVEINFVGDTNGNLLKGAVDELLNDVLGFLQANAPRPNIS